MKLKQAIEIAIASGMTEFEVWHDSYNGKRYRQTTKTIYNFIKDYENDNVLTINFGSDYSYINNNDERVYTQPTLCTIKIGNI